MGVFGFGKKKSDTVDLTRSSNAYVPQPVRSSNVDTVDLRQTPSNSTNESTASTATSTGMDFLNTMASSAPETTSSSNPITQVSEMSDLKIQLRKLTSKLEDSENDVYRLMQRIELLEKKLERFENRGT